MVDEPSQDPGGQTSRSWSVLLTVLGTVLGLASFFTILGLMLANLHPSQPPLSEGGPSPAERLHQLQADDERQLTTYELMDQEKGVWRIPVDVAIDKSLSRTPLRYPALPVLSCLVWNVGVLVGSLELMFGHSNGIEWLEFSSRAALIIFVAFGLNVVWTAITFGAREEPHVYVSQWHILGALFWFPWLYAATNIQIVTGPTNLVAAAPVRGVTQASINWWYGHNALGVWYTPIGLATIYYLLPKVLGRPIHSYYLSILGFWTFALFYNWAGAHHLISGPVPAWLVTVSAVASMMMIIPVGTVAINHHMTMRGYFDVLRFSPTLRFVTAGAMCYTLVSLQGSFMSLRSINEPTHFTHYTIAHAHLGLYAFFTMVMFGAMYYIVPRLTGREWASSHLIRIHFWGTFLGVLMMFLVLTVGGLIQGLELNHASESWHELVDEQGLWRGIRFACFPAN